MQNMGADDEPVPTIPSRCRAALKRPHQPAASSLNGYFDSRDNDDEEEYVEDGNSPEGTAKRARLSTETNDDQVLAIYNILAPSTLMGCVMSVSYAECYFTMNYFVFVRA